MHRIRFERVLGCLAVGLVSILPAYAQEEQPASIDRELNIMARVIAESLDANVEHDKWAPYVVGRSAFEPRVSSQYVPGVGAIFTVPVDFLITQPPQSDEPESENVVPENDDLWERFEKSGVDVRIESPKQIAIVRPEDAVRVHIERDADDEGDERIVTKEILESVQKAVKVGVDREIRDAYTLSFWNRKYDADQVESMRKTIVETIAKYGHRMNIVRDSERIIVVVEAPRSSKSVRVRETWSAENAAESEVEKHLDEARAKIDEARKQAAEAAEHVGESKRWEIKGPKLAGIADLAELGEFYKGQAMWLQSDGKFGFFNRDREPKDRMSFSIEKSRLQGEVAYADLAPYVSEQAY